MADIQKFGEDFQRTSKDGFDASVRSFGEVSKGFQAIARHRGRLREEIIRGRHPRL